MWEATARTVLRRPASHLPPGEAGAKASAGSVRFRSVRLYRSATLPQVIPFQLPHPGVALQGEDLRHRGDGALNPGNASLGQEAAEHVPRRCGGSAARVIAADDETDLAERGDVGERELRVTGRR